MTFMILNIALVGLLLLIAYWWANQGAFSALLHLVCVIVAGAVALAIWEPLVVGFMLKGSGFDNYAWGITLVGTFALLLFALRFAADKLAPANMLLPQWADLLFGGAFGAAAAVLTIGLTFIGIGFVQSSHDIMGYKGYGRRTSLNAIVGPLEPSLWVPVDKYTAEFFSYLSVSTFYPNIGGKPLRQWNPELYKQASLVRDSLKNGTGQLSLAPDAASVTQYGITENNGKPVVVVTVSFNAAARDFGTMLTLSSSQVRLVSDTRGTKAPTVVHPNMWSQELREGSGTFLFDDVSHYATSVPARPAALISFAFPVPNGFSPRFIQIRNMRIRMPAVPVSGTLSELLGATSLPDQGGDVAVGGGGSGGDFTSSVRVSKNVTGLVVSKNTLPGSMSEVDGFLTKGFMRVQRASGVVSRELRIKGIFEDDGTRIVQVDVSRDTPSSIWRVNTDGGSSQPLLVDSKGRTYPAIGYILRTPALNETEIRLVPGSYIQSITELPMLPTSNTKKMHLIFALTGGTQIVGLRMGTTPVASCNVEVGR